MDQLYSPSVPSDFIHEQDQSTVSLDIPYFLDFFYPQIDPTLHVQALLSKINPALKQCPHNGWGTRCKNLITHTTVHVTPHSLVPAMSTSMSLIPLPAMKNWRMMRLEQMMTNQVVQVKLCHNISCKLPNQRSIAFKQYCSILYVNYWMHARRTVRSVTCTLAVQTACTLLISDIDSALILFLPLN